MFFPKVHVGDQQLCFKELTLNGAIDLSKIKASKYERQLSAFLTYILDDQDLPATLTVQQRYFSLIQYLASQSKNDLAININIADFIFTGMNKSFKKQVDVEGIRVRQLIGAEIEILQDMATDISDYLLGAMSLQITSIKTGLPAFDITQDPEIIKQGILKRHALIKELSITEFNLLYQRYLQAENELTSLVSIGFDDQGVILYPRGTDDAPYRFQSNTAITGSARFLYESLARNGTENK